MADDLDGARLRLQRARDLTKELSSQVDRHALGQPIKVEGREVGDSGDLEFVVTRVETPPAMWPVRVGEILHNARTALDHLAWQLVLRDGGKPDRGTVFPITPTPEEFTAVVKRRLRGASNATRAQVRAVSPWRGGNDLLWKLHDLNNHDKHRQLIPVGVAETGTNLIFDGSQIPGLPAGMKEAFNKMEQPVIRLRSADTPVYPVQVGQVVFRIMKAAREGPQLIKPLVTFGVSLTPEDAAEGVEMVPALQSLIEAASSVVERFG